MERIVERVPFAAPSQFARKRVAAYARVSTGKDAMLHSLSAQISYYNQMIQGHMDWVYCGVYADEALTGTKDSRTNFQRMLADCRAGKLDLVITKSISRFARNTVTLLETVRELRSLGVDVCFEEQRIHSISAEGELLLTLLASFAQAESLSASENMKWRIRKGFEKGEVMNLPRMLGYDISKDGMTVNEEQAAIVRGIFSLALEGYSLEAIARHLKERSVTGIYGGAITGSRVREILQNEKYTGNSLLQKTYVNNHLEKKKTRNHGELPMYYAEGTHEAIIDAETYEKVQERLRKISETTADRHPKQRSVFTSIIRCAKCGANFAHALNRKRVWQCLTYKKSGRSACDAKTIPEDILMAVCCEVLGIDAFDEDAFNNRVSFITADNDLEGNILRFTLKSGEEIVKRWKNPSRRESWTPEMKEAAREAGRKGGHRHG